MSAKKACPRHQPPINISPQTLTMATLMAMAGSYVPRERITSISPLGKGNINSTFLVTASDPDPCFVLQRLNPFVFTDPESIMANIRVYSRHAREQIQIEKNILRYRRWEIAEALTGTDGRELVSDDTGACWRAIRFIDKARTIESVRNPEQAREIGQGLAIFHLLSRNIPATALADTLPGFHVTPRYLELYDRVLADLKGAGKPEENLCVRFIDANRNSAGVLEKAKQKGILTTRAIHGDPKIDNFMVDETTGQVVGLIDLDTIIPGLVLHDIGDCLRSACNPGGEDPPIPEDIRFEPDLCRALLTGYLRTGNTALSPAEYEYLFAAIRLIPFELGLRFFTDHLAGNPYFTTRYPGQNLVRAMNQFRLVESIDREEKNLRTMISDLSRLQ